MCCVVIWAHHFYFYLTKFVCSLYFVFISILKPVTLFLHFFFLLLIFLDKTLDKPKSGTLKSPPKGFDTTIINKTYYNVVSITILRNSMCVCVCLCVCSPTLCQWMDFLSVWAFVDCCNLFFSTHLFNDCVACNCGACIAPLRVSSLCVRACVCVCVWVAQM